jgi:hypothetical protein
MKYYADSTANGKRKKIILSFGSEMTKHESPNKRNGNYLIIGVAVDAEYPDRS